MDILDQDILFYNKPLEKISEISVQILGPDGKLIPIGYENSITLEITETKNILKETLIDSKRGDIITTGKII